MSAASSSSASSDLSSPLCLLTLQPITSLALICRCLNAADLLAVCKSCKRLSDAAAHPLTFQHEFGWRVVPDHGVTVMGPRAVCRTESDLDRALASRLFKSFRLLHLGSFSNDLAATLLLKLDSPATPTLHVLSVSWSCLLFRDVSLVHHLQSLRFLRVLCIAAHRIGLTPRGPPVQFPPLLEMLQIEIAFREKRRSTLALTPLLEALPPLQRFRTFVVCSSGPYATTHLDDLVFLQKLEEAVPQIEEIHWIMPIKLRRLQRELQAAVLADSQAPIPCVHKVTFLQTRLMESVDEIPSAELSAPNPLLSFPNLVGLRLWHDCSPVFLKAPADFTQRLLEWLPRARLSSLRSLTIFESTKHQSLGLLDLAPVFASMPLLESISLPHWNVRPEGFMLLPQLRSAQITWSSSMKAADPDMRAAFPSLCDLHVRSVEGSALLFSRQLLAIPNLKRLKWNEGPVTTPQQIRMQLAKIEARRIKLIESREQAAASAVEQAAASVRERLSQRAKKQAAEAELPAEPFQLQVPDLPEASVASLGGSSDGGSSDLTASLAAVQLAPAAADMGASPFAVTASSSSFVKSGGRFASRKTPSARRGGQQGFASSFAAPVAASTAAQLNAAAAPAPPLLSLAVPPAFVCAPLAAAAASHAAFASFASFGGTPLAPMPSFAFGAPADFGALATTPFVFVAPAAAACSTATATVEEEGKDAVDSARQ